MKIHSNMLNSSEIRNCNGRKLFWLSLYITFASFYWTCTTQSVNASLVTNASSIVWNESQYYKAAVVDLNLVSKNSDVHSSSRTNVQNLVNIIAECGRQKIDIVVFPEGGIYDFFPMGRFNALSASSYVPSANDFIIPCNNTNYKQSFLHDLSCAAKENEIYVAVDLIEKVRSSESPYLDGFLIYYNTAVVFDRNGMVVARYRKFNLYIEKWLMEVSSTDEPEHVTFTTDFGVTFGMLICFDVFFAEPGVELVKKYNATDFLHLSQMQSRLPFLGAASVDSGWSYSLDVVVLSSTIPSPKNNLGTNIYFGRRPGTSTYVKSYKKSKIIIAPVPKNRLQQTPEYPRKYDSLPKYIPNKNRQNVYLVEKIQNRMTTTPIMVGNQTNGTFSYQDAKFQCNISVSWEHTESIINYQFAAYSGLNNFSVASINNYVEICGITLCSRSSVSSCQQPPYFDDAFNMTFLSLNISTRSAFQNALRIPTASDSYLAALNVENFDFNIRVEDYFGKSWNHVDMKLQRPITNLMAFGVYKYPMNSYPIPNFNLFDLSLNEKTVKKDVSHVST